VEISTIEKKLHNNTIILLGGSPLTKFSIWLWLVIALSILIFLVFGLSRLESRNAFFSIPTQQAATVAMASMTPTNQPSPTTITVTMTPVSSEQRLALMATAIAQTAEPNNISFSDTITYTNANTGYVQTQPANSLQISKEFIASARLYVPNTADRRWSYGFFFWEDKCRLIFGENRKWLVR